MGLIWCLVLLVNVKALATLSRKKKQNTPQWENGKGMFGDNAVGFTCAIWRSYYGKELNVRTHYMLGDNRGSPIRQSHKKEIRP